MPPDCSEPDRFAGAGSMLRQMRGGVTEGVEVQFSSGAITSRVPHVWEVRRGQIRQRGTSIRKGSETRCSSGSSGPNPLTSESKEVSTPLQTTR